jgi:hypothetical protein
MMARLKTNTAKQAERGRETNAQRRKREDQRRAILAMAEGIASSIHSRRVFSSILEKEGKSYGKDFLAHAGWAESQSIENIAKALRLAADILEEKPRDGRSYSDHDKEIVIAFAFARPFAHPHRAIYNNDGSRCVIGTEAPTFSEFIEVYRKLNPKVKVEARTLRRSLRRLGLPTLPGKRGRPREK